MSGPTFKPRRLTVSEFLEFLGPSGARGSACYRALRVRLVGKWISEAGFAEGDRITVESQAPGVLVLRREGAPPG